MESLPEDKPSGKRKRKVMGVYQIIHEASGRCYIGSTIDFTARKYAHRWHLKAGSHHSPKLQNAWRCYGAGAFRFELLEEVSDPDLLLQREQDYLDKFHPWYNLAADATRSMLGRRQSEKFFAAIKEAGHKRRREFCGRGHPLSGTNLHIRPDGGRACRACLNANSRRHREMAAERQGRALCIDTAARTTCAHGHPYSGENLIVSPRGWRYCRTCKAIDAHERYLRKKAERARQKAEGDG